MPDDFALYVWIVIVTVIEWWLWLLTVWMVMMCIGCFSLVVLASICFCSCCLLALFLGFRWFTCMADVLVFSLLFIVVGYFVLGVIVCCLIIWFIEYWLMFLLGVCYTACCRVIALRLFGFEFGFWCNFIYFFVCCALFILGFVTLVLVTCCSFGCRYRLALIVWVWRWLLWLRLYFLIVNIYLHFVVGCLF